QEPLPGPEGPDGARRPHQGGERLPPDVPRRGARRLVLPGRDHVLELGRARWAEPRRGDRQAALPGPGDLQEGGGAPLRDPRRSLGRADRRGRAAEVERAWTPTGGGGGGGGTSARSGDRSRARRSGTPR